MSKFRMTVSAAALAALASSATAGVIAADDFSGYAAGALVPQSTAKTGFTGAWSSNSGLTGTTANTVVVASDAGNPREEVNATGGSVAYRGLAGGATLADTAGATYYVRFSAQNTNGGPRFFGVSLFSGGTERMLIGQSSNASNWGLSNAGTSTTPGHAFATTAASTLLAKVVFGGAGANEQVTLWVDPDLGAAENGDVNDARRVGTYTSNTDFGTIDRLRIGGGATSGTSTYATHWIDDLSIFRADTPTETPFASLPEPASLAAMGAGVAMMARRRRRHA